MNNERKNNAKRLAYALERHSSPSMIQQLAMLLNYNEPQLEKDISELIAYIEYLEETKEGNKLKKVRKLKGFTQTELADLAKVSRQAITNWERGYREMSIPNAKKLAKALECSIDDIV